MIQPLLMVSFFWYIRNRSLTFAKILDVTSGDNRCSINNCCQYGYGAIKGWDAVVSTFFVPGVRNRKFSLIQIQTGFGTPNFMQMKKYVSNMP